MLERWSQSRLLYPRSWYTFVKRTGSSTILIYFHLGMSQCESSFSQEKENWGYMWNCWEGDASPTKYYCSIDSCNHRHNGHHLNLEPVKVPADHRNSFTALSKHLIRIIMYLLDLLIHPACLVLRAKMRLLPTSCTAFAIWATSSFELKCDVQLTVFWSFYGARSPDNLTQWLVVVLRFSFFNPWILRPLVLKSWRSTVRVLGSPLPNITLYRICPVATRPPLRFIWLA